jgi:hypothetical protein
VNEVAFVQAFFRERLAVFETECVADTPRETLMQHVEQAGCMLQSLRDLASPDGGNYVALPRTLNETLDVNARLLRFVASASQRLGLSVADEGVVAHPTLALQKPRASVREYPLDTFLADLLKRSDTVEEPDLAAAEWRHFSPMCERLLNYMEFLLRSSQRDQPSRFVFLLRDTLLLYLGMCQLHDGGWCAPPAAMLLNRDVIRSFAPSLPRDGLYAGIFNLLYETLRLPTQSFDIPFVTRHGRILRADAPPERATLLAFLEAYAAELGNDAPYIIVETGVHGTMPLLLMSVTSRIIDLRMYTVVPWLQSFFRRVIFTTNSAHMRQVETSVCQEALFQFSRVVGSRVFINETTDETIRHVAHQEIRAFRSAVARRFRERLTTSAPNEGPNER